MDNNTDQIQTEVVSSDEHQLNRILQGLWERVRRAGELVGELRSENGKLAQRADTLERELSRVRSELAGQEELVRSLHEQLSSAGNAGKDVMTNGERQQLAAKVRELLARIDGYL